MGVYIIAEAGVNHNGSFDLACRLVDAAKAAGADCIKFQTFRAQNLVSGTPEKRTIKRIPQEAALRLICSPSWNFPTMPFHA